MISPRRIKGLLRQEWHISRRSLEVIADVPFFAVMSVLVTGYVSLAIVGRGEKILLEYLVLGALLWEVLRIGQYCMTVNSFWNIWSRNLSNIFISPLSLHEYLVTQMLSGLWKSLFVLVFLLAPISAVLFHFNILSIGYGYLAFVIVNLLIFSWSVGLILLGAVFRYGTRVQALGWSLIYIFQPLCAAFYPVTILPPPVQRIAFLFPITYVFEGARTTLSSGIPSWTMQGEAFIINMAYFIAAIALYRFFLYRSRDSGQFARNES